MLAAVVRMAGATSGVVRVAAADGVAIWNRWSRRCRAVPGPERNRRAPAGGAIARWCSRCPESRDPRSDCVRIGLCGRDDRFGADLAGWACRHVVALPLRVQGGGAGAINLWFEAPGELPAATTQAVQAAADLVAATLEHDRAARETLQTSLSSERQMMANEVHDSLAQGLTYMRMRMSLLRDAVRQGDHVRAFKYWSDVDISLTHAHRRLRELITYFRSRMDPQGLLHALEETSESFLDRTGVALEFVNKAPGFHLPVAREVQAFHIVQEALANVCKHANARRARLTLAPTEGGYEILVEDDGVGMADGPRVRRARRCRALRHRDHARARAPAGRRADARKRAGGRYARAVILPCHGNADRIRAMSAAGPPQGARPPGASGAKRRSGGIVQAPPGRPKARMRGLREVVHDTLCRAVGRRPRSQTRPSGVGVAVLARAALGGKARSAKGAPMSEPISVVLIDDHGLCRRGLAELLEQRAGIKVLGTTGNPDEAVRLLREGRPDLVVMDLRMAPVDGFSLLARIRAEGIDTPVVVLTMSDLKDDLARAFRAGVRGYLLKDMDPDDVIDAIRRTARGEVVVAPLMAAKLVDLLVPSKEGKTRDDYLKQLTEREREILQHLASGKSNKAIAQSLDISHDTVKLHVRHILAKLGLTSRVEAAVFAVEHRVATEGGSPNRAGR